MKTTYIIGLALLGLLTACSTPEKPPYGGLKIGKPYQIYGRWYRPGYESEYDEIGMASWYGPGFHGGKTANGERYDQNAMTAAHRTLPLPSIVRVTNLSNGKSAIVRVNDRGPFARSRIIDLSKAAASKLGIIGTGTAKVRVQFLDAETRAYLGGKSYADAVEQGHEHYVPPVQPIPEPVHEDIFTVVDNAYADPAPAAAPVRTATVNSGGGFFVQAGTFGIKTNARQLHDRLAQLGDSSVMEILANHKKLYRVMMGPFYAQADAKNMLSKLAAVGISDAKIIRN